MLKQIAFRIPGESPATIMDVAAPNSTTRYLVKNVEGLGPVKADVTTSSLALLDGVSFDNARTGLRNIVIDFEYMPDWATGRTVYQLRQELYQIAGPKKMVELTFVIEGVGSRKIVGVVESVESEMFSQDLTAQMSVICPDPYFIGEEKQHTLVPATNNTINYEGDVPSAVVMGYTLSVVGQNMRFRHHHASTGWEELRVNDTIPADAGLMISTVPRDKHVKLWSGVNLLPKLTVLDFWKLHPGKNTVSLIGRTINGSYPAQGTYSFSYKVLYGGL